MELEDFIKDQGESLNNFKQNMLHLSVRERSSREWMEMFLAWSEWYEEEPMKSSFWPEDN